MNNQNTPQKATVFLNRYNLNTASVDTDKVLEDFLLDMEKGLADKSSSLAMIPTFITVGRPVPANEKVIVIDAGGTNLRITTVVFDAQGKPTMPKPEPYQMPGIDCELSKTDFFKHFADYLAPVIDQSDQVGFCFSYPAEISPNRDGKLLRWTKEIKAPEVVGQYIGKGLKDALGDKGTGKEITILNDTIATLLAGKSAGGGKQYSSYVGFILGTGTNTAYVEKNSNITKRNDLNPNDTQAINVESGNFNKCPRSPIDLAFDQTTADPGTQAFEKMISGGYLGGLCLQTLKTATGEAMFTSQTSQIVNSLKELTTKQVSLFLANPQADGPLTQIEGEDKTAAAGLFHGIIERAALLTAINMSAAVLKSGAGDTPAQPICINVDGSTYYKLSGFQSMTVDFLKDILGSKKKAFELTYVADAPTIGAAVAGLTH